MLFCVFFLPYSSPVNKKKVPISMNDMRFLVLSLKGQLIIHQASLTPFK